MLPLNHIQSRLTREERLRLNENWNIITNGINSLQSQINTIYGGEVDAIIIAIENALTSSKASAADLARLLVEVSDKVSQVSTAIENANTATSNANTASSAAETAATQANNAVTDANNATALATNATKSANDVTVLANAKIQEVIQAIGDITTLFDDMTSKLETFESESSKALADSETATQNADNAASSALEVVNELAGYNIPNTPFSLTTKFIKHQAARFNGSTFRAKKETLGNPLPVAPAVENEWWTLESQRGVDGQGAVQSVNGHMPGPDGDVQLQIAVSKEDIGLGNVDNTADRNKPVSGPQQRAIELAVNTIVETGIPKLVTHEFLVTAESDGQRVYTYSDSLFSDTADTLLIWLDAEPLNKNEYTTSFSEPNVTITISDTGATVGSILRVVVFRNVPLGPSGSVSSNVLADSTITASKLHPELLELINDKSTTSYAIASALGFTPASSTDITAIESILGTGEPITEQVLTRGVNDVSSPSKTLAKVKRIDGRTIVNYTPLFDSGAWTLHTNATVKSPTRIEVNTTSQWQASYTDFPVKPNQEYTANVTTNAVYYIKDAATLTTISGPISGGPRTFTTPSGTNRVRVELSNNVATGSFYFDTVTLNEGPEPQPFVANIKGLTNPTVVNETNGTSLVVPTTLYDGEYVEQNSKGELVKHKKWGETPIDASLNWKHEGDISNYTGYKRVIAPLNLVASAKDSTYLGVKYNGSILSYYDKSPTSADQLLLYKPTNEIYLSIANTDSGWGQDYTPTPEEIKAYFLGWSMREESGGLYTAGTKYWVRATQKSFPPDWKGSVATTALPTVMADETPTARKWQPYRVLYELDAPTKEVIRPVGNLTLEKGENSVKVYAGRIVNEKIPFKLNALTGYYISNIKNTHESPSLHSQYKYQTKAIHKVYENSKLFTKILIEGEGSAGAPYIYGKENVNIHVSNYDPTASYTVDYEPLYTWEVSAPIDNVILELYPNLVNTVEQLVSDVVNNSNDITFLQNNSVLKGDGVKWITPTLLNGWAHSETNPVNYSKDSIGNVKFKGLTYGGLFTPGTTAFILPPKYRPATAQIFPVRSWDNGVVSVSTIVIRQDGTVQIDSGKNEFDVSSIGFKAEQ